MEAIESQKFETGRMSILIIGLAVLACLSWGGQAQAARPGRLSIQLSRITPAGGADLTGLKDSLNLKIPIPERWRVSRAHLNLAYYHSTALLAERSRLVIRLNGLALAQAILDPRSPEGVLQVDLPPDLLLADYNDLKVSAILNYTDQCRDPAAPELWVNLRLDESSLELDYSWIDLPPNLSAIATTIFDPKIPLGPGVHLVLPDYEPQTLHWAALAATGAALRYGYRQVEITVSGSPAPNKDNIVIGSREFVASAAGLEPERLGTGNLGLWPLPGPEGQVDRAFALIGLTGQKPEEIEQAVRAFSIISFPWPDAAQAKITGVKLPVITRYSGRGLIKPGQGYLFQDLGLETTTLRGFNPPTADLTFRLPADFLAKANDQIKIILHLAYGAGLRRDSALNLHLNDQFIATIPLDDPRGGRYDAYQVQIPTSLLKPGFNKLAGQAFLMTQQTGPCQLIQPDSLLVTLFGDSKLEVPELEQWVAMPEISLFFQDGFPLASWPDWRNGLVFLAEKDPALVGAALGLVAMIGQKTGIPCYGLEFAYDLLPDADKDVLALGSLKALPQTLIKASPLSSGLSFPFWGRLPFVQKIEGLISGWGSGPGAEPEERPELAEMATDLTLKKGKMLILEFEADSVPTRTVLLVGAGSNEDLLAGVMALGDPAVHYQCRQDTVLIDYTAKPKKVFTQKSAPTYFIGQLSRLTWLDRVTHNHPLIFYLVLAAVIILIAYILTRIMRRLKRKRLTAGGSAS